MVILVVVIALLVLFIFTRRRDKDPYMPRDFNDFRRTVRKSVAFGRGQNIPMCAPPATPKIDNLVSLTRVTCHGWCFMCYLRYISQHQTVPVGHRPMEFVIFIDLFEIARSMFTKPLFNLEDIPLIDVYSFRCYGTYF